MSILAERKLRLTRDDLEAVKAAGWKVTELIGSDRGRTHVQLHHPRTGRVRTARYVVRAAA